MEVSALDEKGKPVDWWFIYKVPQLAGGANADSATGYEYVYYDPNLSKVDKSPHFLNQDTGALNFTLDSVFKHAATTTGWILYNDEAPAGAKLKDDGNLGHTKGVIAFDTASQTALWLVHSWPQYPTPGVAGMPTPDYGQTFLCLALDTATASQLAAQMANHQEPQTYLPRIPASLANTDPIYLLTQPLNPSAPSAYDVLAFKTRAGLAFKVIAKNRKWGQDFWNDLVAPTLGVSMDVETWIRGKIPPTTDKTGQYKIIDVKYIDLRPLGAPWVWPESKDHAKWGISLTADWICVGDINRMVSQENRGGGTVAFQEPKLWQALSKTDLIVPPPGQTEADARAMIKKINSDAKQAATTPTKPEK